MTDQERKARRQQELAEYQRIVSYQLSESEAEKQPAAPIQGGLPVRGHRRTGYFSYLLIILLGAGSLYLYRQVETLDAQNELLSRQISENQVQVSLLAEDVSVLKQESERSRELSVQEALKAPEEASNTEAQSEPEVLMSVIYPLRDSSVILHPFGPYEEEDGSHANCSGMDLGVGEGSQVLAANNGMVSFAGADEETGNTVKIDHGNGYETFYGYTGEVLVTEGQKVNAGDAIAITGADENGVSHLEFRISYNGNYINPEKLLDIVG